MDAERLLDLEEQEIETQRTDGTLTNEEAKREQARLRSKRTQHEILTLAEENDRHTHGW